MKRRTALAALMAVPLFAHSRLVHQTPRKHPRRVPPIDPPPELTEVVITGTDLLIGQMYANEPTTVKNAQNLFRCSTWNNVDYDEATLLQVQTWPPELTGETLESVELRLWRSDGNAVETKALSAKQVLRTDVNFAQLCWDLRATGSSWQTGGAQGALDAGAALTTVDITNVLDDFLLPSSAGLIAFAEAAIAGGSQDVLLLHIAAATGHLNTFDGPTGTNPPQLICRYLA